MVEAQNTNARVVADTSHQSLTYSPDKPKYKYVKRKEARRETATGDGRYAHTLDISNKKAEDPWTHEKKLDEANFGQGIGCGAR